MKNRRKKASCAGWLLSAPIKGETYAERKEYAKKICLNTVRNQKRRWESGGRVGAYLESLAKRYAPVGAENDPDGLNRHWLHNVRFFLAQKGQ